MNQGKGDLEAKISRAVLGAMQVAMDPMKKDMEKLTESMMQMQGKVDEIVTWAKLRGVWLEPENMIA